MEKDITGRAAESAARTLLGAKRRIRALIPLGPSQVRIAPGELRKLLKTASPGTLDKYLKSLGPEKALQMLLNTKDRIPGPLDFEQFVEESNAR